MRKLTLSSNIITILTILVIIVQVCCTNRNPKSVISDNVIDSSKKDTIIAVLPVQDALRSDLNRSHPAELSPHDMLVVDSVLNRAVDEYNFEHEKQFEIAQKRFGKAALARDNYMIELKRYKRQYFPYLNSRHQKEVWVNCFCETYALNWRKEMVFAEDGGNCYFNLKINVYLGKYYDFGVNGLG